MNCVYLWIKLRFNQGAMCSNSQRDFFTLGFRNQNISGGLAVMSTTNVCISIGLSQTGAIAVLSTTRNTVFSIYNSCLRWKQWLWNKVYGT